MMENSSTKGASKIKKTHGTVLGKVLVAIIIRYLLMKSKYQKIIATHVEVSTPLNSWKRIMEGQHLYSKKINPYEGDIIHETPMTLLLYKTLISTIGLPPEILFIACDLATALLLYYATRKYMFQVYVQQKLNANSFLESSKDFLLKPLDFNKAPIYVFFAYIFNPYIVFNCIGCTTTVYLNFLLSAFLCSTVYGNVILSSFFLAISTTVSFYVAVLVVPFVLYFTKIHKTVRAQLIIPLFLGMLLSILYFNSCFDKDLLFVSNIYGFIITVPDLTPNIGLFWYFFTEMFDHFRELFIFSFQINASILYLFPLSIKFRNEPFVLITALLSLITVFKSYPCIGNVGFVLSLLPCFRHLLNYSQQGFLEGVIFLITSALCPILWHLWIYCNSANANFYFGVTLAFAVAQIFLVTDILFAYVKREFYLIHGKERKVDNKEAILILD